MKLGLMMNRRAVELRRRGLTKDQSEKQAGAEVIQFLEMWRIDLSSVASVLWAEENFPIFTRLLDSTPPHVGGEDSTGSTNSELTSRGHDSEQQHREQK